MSRLQFAPKLKEIEVTDIQKGLGVFTPKPDQTVSFAALKETLKKAGYTLNSADLTVSGTLAKDDKGWAIIATASGQRLSLVGPNVDHAVAGSRVGSSLVITGDWKTVGTGATAYETISPTIGNGEARVDQRSPFYKVSFTATAAPAEEHPAVAAAKPRAPIRVTSPGLTVYKGGAVTPRLYLIKQHLGELDVTRAAFDVSLSYTPSPRAQLELEVPVSRASYRDNGSSGSTSGLGNITGWVKYRFFRKVKTYGDRQAALRVGLETPTGQKSAPAETTINVPAFVRQQLTPISGGWAPHFDLAFSQAGGRLIFGGNTEIIFRSERDGFRMGHEQRVNTDLEYVLPKDARKPGGEVFLILETMFVHHGSGRLSGNVVDGSRATEYYLAPGLQYAARPRFVIEGSFQLPVLRNTGPLLLRTDRNILLGVKYLF